MKYEHLSGYTQFILLAGQASGVSANLTTYLAYKDVVKVLEECAKSDTPSIRWQAEYIEKPITRAEALVLLDKLNNNKWDKSIKSIAHHFKIELR
jgi:hypothetical protein